MRERRTYTQEFRAGAVALVERRDRSLVQVAADLGVNYWTLRNWYNAAMAMRTSSSTAAAASSNETIEQRVARLEREVVRLERENARLRKENERLDMERETLKKAVAFFAKESK